MRFWNAAKVGYDAARAASKMIGDASLVRRMKRCALLFALFFALVSHCYLPSAGFTARYAEPSRTKIQPERAVTLASPAAKYTRVGSSS